MKKVVFCAAMLLAVTFVLSCFASCGTVSTVVEGGGEKQGEDQGKGKGDPGKDKTGSVKIEDIEWSVGNGIIDGSRYVVLDYTNNSQYTIVEFDMTFTEKDDITEEEKSKYLEDIKINLGIDMNDPEDAEGFEKLKKMDIEMSMESENVAKPGESVSSLHLYYYQGFYYVNNLDHYSLVVPDIATIRYIKDDKIYTVYYDFVSNKYTEDKSTEPAYYWSESELGKALPKPDAARVYSNCDVDTRFSFYVCGWSIDDFNAYVNECKDFGYTIVIRAHDGFYAAESENGYSINLDYYEDDFEMCGAVMPKENSD